MVKWTAAGVAAANLIGGIIAVRMTMAGHGESLAVWLFAVGIVAACAGAMAFEYMERHMEGPHLEASRYWAQVDFGAKRDARREADLQAKLAREGRWLRIPPLIGLASIGLFVVGSLLLILH